jgi:hypothetical protein
MSLLPEPTSHSLPASPATVSGSARGPLGPVPVLAPQPEPPRESEPVPPPGRGHQEPQRIPRWLERSELFLRVLLRMYIGLAVTVAPWWPVFWDQNPLFMRFPALSALAVHGAVRGMVSGLGLLNLWIAFRDAIRHRDD